MYDLYSADKLVNDLNNKFDIDLILENKFKFTRKYDMERCEQEVELNPIDWSHVPFGDDEWKFVFHRMDYCLDLCIETIKTGDFKYIEKSKELIFDFMSKETEFEKQSGLRTLDTGIRLIVWTKCIEYYKQFEVISKDELAEICDSIEWQTRLLYTNYSKFQKFSNWGLMQCVGILNAARYVDIDDEVLSFYEQTFYSHLNTQFMDDGMQWEQSSVYIIEVATRLAQLSNPKYWTKQFYDLLIKSARAIYACGNFDQLTILLGDGDRIDTVGFVQHIAYLTKDPELLSYVQGTKLREEVYFEFGDGALVFFESLEPTTAKRLDFDLADCGLYTIKDEDKYLSFQNGNLGGGHGHFDNLHVNFSLDREKVLVDSGRFNYVEGYETRRYYKEVSAHNGFELEDNIYEYAGAWGTSGCYMYTPIVKRIKAGITYMEASIHKDGMNALRKVIYLPSGELVLIDTCNRDYKLNFITDYENTVEQLADNSYLIGENVSATIFNANTEIADCYVSPTYNKREQSKKIVVSNQQQVVISAFTSRDTKVERDEIMTYFYGVSGNPINNSLDSIRVQGADYEYVIAHLPYEYGTNNSVLSYEQSIGYGSLVVYNVKTDEFITFKY